MYNLVKIGEKTVPMMSMASTDLYYRNIFHEDAIKLQTAKELDEGDLMAAVEGRNNLGIVRNRNGSGGPSMERMPEGQDPVLPGVE